MNKVLDATARFLRGRAWNTERLQHVLGSWNWFLLLSQPAMSSIQECYALASNEKLPVLAAEKKKHELRLLMVLAPLFYASMRRENADVMLCSDTRIVGSVTLNTDFVKWPLPQSKVLKNFHSQLSRKLDLPSCGGKRSYGMPGAI